MRETEMKSKNQCPIDHSDSKDTHEQADVDPKTLPLPPLAGGGLPFIGPAFEVMDNPMKFCLKARREHGDIFRFKVAHREYYVLSGFDGCEFAARQGRDKLKSGALWADLMKEWDSPNQIVGIDGAKHTEARRMFKPMMSKNLAGENHEMIEEVTREMIGRISTGQEVSVSLMTRQLVNNLISFIFNGERTELPEAFINDTLEWQRQTFNMLVLKKWPKFFKYILPSFNRREKQVWGYIEKMKAERRANPKEDFGSKVIAAAKENPHLFETEGDINFGFLAPLFAGADTVGTTSTFMIHELCFNPTVRERVRKAVDKVVDENEGKIPEPQWLRDNCPELYGICQETLRLYPTAFAIGRTATQDFTFNGYQVPKNSEVLIFTTANHFDPEYFPDPWKFDIDRYAPPRAEHKKKYGFLPYGIGTHTCLGAGFSELMFLSVAATIIYHFDFEVADPHRSYKQVFDPSLGIEQSFKIRMKGWRH